MWFHTVVTTIALATVPGSLASAQERSVATAMLTAQERVLVHAGGLVTKVVDTDDRAEVMSVSALRTPVDLGRFMECARSPLGFARSEDSLGAGRISDPPAASDLAELRLDERDVAFLERWRPGDCKVRLAADAISRFEHEVDWTANDRVRPAEAAFHEMLAQQAAAYLAEGRRGLPDFADGPNSVYRALGLGELLLRPLFLLEGAPELREYLRGFPRGRPHLVDEFLAWRKDRFWKKPVIGLFHVVIWESVEAHERRILVVTQQLYASHYIESGVEVLELRQGASETEAEITFLSRARADIRPSGFNWLERVLLRRLVRGRLQDQFDSLRARLAPDHGAAFREATRPGSSAAPGMKPRGVLARVRGSAETRTRAGADSPPGTAARP